MPTSCIAKEILDMLYLEKSQITLKKWTIVDIFGIKVPSHYFSTVRDFKCFGDGGDLFSTLRSFTNPIPILALLSWQMD